MPEIILDVTEIAEKAGSESAVRGGMVSSQPLALGDTD
jgi:hypothetical protein